MRQSQRGRAQLNDHERPDPLRLPADFRRWLTFISLLLLLVAAADRRRSVFLGTETYPDENSYSAFLSSHGGSSNAYTSTENTNYYVRLSRTLGMGRQLELERAVTIAL
jgi:hypothetical protein